MVATYTQYAKTIYRSIVDNFERKRFLLFQSNAVDTWILYVNIFHRYVINKIVRKRVLFPQNDYLARVRYNPGLFLELGGEKKILSCSSENYWKNV